MKTSVLSTCLSIAMLASVAGCGYQTPLFPVTGTVLIDGQPVTMGNIMVAPKSGPVSYSKIDAQGKFSLITRDGEGCVIGNHPVAITANELFDNGNPMRQLVPRRYNDFQTSGLTIKVTTETAPITIELSSEELSKEVTSINGDQVP